MKNPHLYQSPEGVNTKTVAVVAVVSIIIGLLAVGGAWWMTPAARRAKTPVVQPLGTIAGVEQGPIRGPARGQIMQARALENISALGWTDPGAALAHIPIARAMDMIARGCRPPGAGASAFGASDPSCSTAAPPPEVAGAAPFESRDDLESTLGHDPAPRVETPARSLELRRLRPGSGDQPSRQEREVPHIHERTPGEPAMGAGQR